MQRTLNIQNDFETEEQTDDLHLKEDFKTFSKATVSIAVHLWHKLETETTERKIRVHKKMLTFMVTSFSAKALRKINGEKSLLHESAGMSGYPQAKGRI